MTWKGCTACLRLSEDSPSIPSWPWVNKTHRSLRVCLWAELEPVSRVCPLKHVYLFFFLRICRSKITLNSFFSCAHRFKSYGFGTRTVSKLRRLPVLTFWLCLLSHLCPHSLLFPKPVLRLHPQPGDPASASLLFPSAPSSRPCLVWSLAEKTSS